MRPPITTIAPDESSSVLDQVDRTHENILMYLLRGAANAIPGYSPSAIWRRVKILAIWLSNFNILQTWHAIVTNKHLPPGAGQHPLAMGVALWPYIHAKWNFIRRAKVIENHYQQVAAIAPKLAVPAYGNLLLAKLDSIRPGLNLMIDRAQWFLREGELVINIFLENKRLFSIAFALGKDDSGDVIIIGGIQGVHTDNISEIYRSLTKELHGIRPRDMIIISLKMLCNSIGIKRILAIADASRQHRNSYFEITKTENLILNYDEVWSEHGGVLKESGFYEFSSKVERRAEASIPSRKRATYRRRYEFLKLLEIDIKRNLNRL